MVGCFINIKSRLIIKLSSSRALLLCCSAVHVVFVSSLCVGLFCGLCGHHRSAAISPERNFMLIENSSCIFMCDKNFEEVLTILRFVPLVQKEGWQYTEQHLQMVTCYHVSLGSVYNKSFHHWSTAQSLNLYKCEGQDGKNQIRWVLLPLKNM